MSRVHDEAARRRGLGANQAAPGDCIPRKMIRNYIKNQEMADKQLDQLRLKLASS